MPLSFDLFVPSVNNTQILKTKIVERKGTIMSCKVFGFGTKLVEIIFGKIIMTNGFATNMVIVFLPIYLMMLFNLLFFISTLLCNMAMQNTIEDNRTIGLIYSDITASLFFST